MDTSSFVIVAVFVLAFGLISGRLQTTFVSPPMVFVTFGLVLGPAGLGLVWFDVESEMLRTLAEATLALVLFTDASRIDLRLLRRQYRLPARLLGIGLPLTIVAGAVVAVALFDGLSFWEAAVAAAILAPTDAALGQAVVVSPRVPVRMRQALNVESGLNDGLALPAVLILISLAARAESAPSADYWLGYAAAQLILGPLAGVAIGYLGGKMVDWGTSSGWMNHAFQQISALAVALLAFTGAESVGGNGFIAAFAAGLTLGNTAKRVCTCLIEFAEAEGQLLVLLAFLVFGAAQIGPVLRHFHAPLLLYALLSLTLVRMLPVSLSLLGSGLSSASHLFLGWFGPRGLASILYVFLVLDEVELAGRETIFEIVITTVALSVFAHGVSAWPGAWTRCPCACR